MHKDKKRVLVAMSGGVDSSVALIKILEMGYEAIGVTLKLWENRDKKTNKVSFINKQWMCKYWNWKARY